MRRCGKILAETLQKLKQAAKPGIKTEELNELCIRLCEENGTTPTFLGYRNFPGAICSSVNEQVVHAIPGKYELKPGDLVSIDCGMTLQGLITDATISFIVKGKDNPKAERLLKVGEKALRAGIKEIKPGKRVGDISFAIQSVVQQAGYHIIKHLTGHGVGRELHEPPIINNFGKKGQGPALKPGMTLAIEPIIGEKTRHTKTLEDNWTIATKDGSLSIQIEHTILVTPQGHEILTLSS